MALFTRRVLQNFIDQSSCASSKARRSWVRRLNSSDAYERVAAEWELVVVHTLSRIGVVNHEPKLTGSTQLDVVFSLENLEFAADITTVSDRGLHEQNPIETLAEELRKIYQAEGLSKGALLVSVNDLSHLYGRAKKKRRLVPPIQDFPKLIFNEGFFLWIAQIKRFPEAPTHIDTIYRHPESRIRFSYVPGRKGSGLNQYTDYRVPSVINQNPLYYALASKLDQLNRSGFEGKKGIILCDGGTGALRPRISGEINAREIVLEFLKEHSEVGFVVTLSLRNLDMSTIRQRIEGELYVSKIEPWHEQLEGVFARMLETLPRVRQNADNARFEIKQEGGPARPNLGELTVSYGDHQIQKVTMSTRTLLDLLSGRLDVETFNKYYSHGNGRGLFEELVRAGLTIQSATVCRTDQEDEDRIEFTFAGPDPALSPFRLRPKNTASDPQTS